MSPSSPPTGWGLHGANRRGRLLGKARRRDNGPAPGSAHPRHGFLYPVNYGFVPGTLSPDGAELDAYVLGVPAPLAEFTGQLFTDSEIRSATHFQEQFFSSVILSQG